MTHKYSFLIQGSTENVIAGRTDFEEWRSHWVCPSVSEHLIFLAWSVQHQQSPWTHKPHH